MSAPLSPYTLLRVYLRPLRGQVIALLVLLLCSSALQVGLPQLIRIFIDGLTAGTSSHRLMLFVGLFLLGTALSQVLSVATVGVGQWVAWSATNALRSELALHCLGLDMSFHFGSTPGQLIERVDGDVGTLSNYFSQFALTVIGGGLMLAGVVGVIAHEDRRLGLGLLLSLIVAFIILRRARRVRTELARNARQASATFFGLLEEWLYALDDLRCHRAGPFILRKFRLQSIDLLDRQYRTGITGDKLLAISWLLFSLCSVSILGVSCLLYLQHDFTLGTVYVTYSYVQLLSLPLNQLSDQLNDLQSALGSIQRIGQLLHQQPSICDGPAACPFPDGPLTVEATCLSYRYDRDDVLTAVSFQLAPGHTLGIVGRTGSGKTTLARLLVRSLDPTSGAILFNGLSHTSIKLADMRRHIGMITQETHLFRASVRDNLTLFDPSVTDERLLQVVGEIGLQPWLSALPAGLDSEIMGEGGVSAGEAQLLSLARIFLADPSLIILDEASARLDPQTQQLVDQAIRRLLPGRTAIIIAHRLETLHFVSDILVLEHGRVTEQGSRAALEASPGSRFSQLLRANAQGEAQ